MLTRTTLPRLCRGTAVGTDRCGIVTNPALHRRGEIYQVEDVRVYEELNAS